MKNFEIASDTAVVSSTYIFKENQPVLYVIHNADNDWQFHSGNHDYANEKLMLVSLSEVLDMDSKLNEVADLPENHCAERGSVGDKWVYYRLPPAE